jgi:hypothetical protein
MTRTCPLRAQRMRIISYMSCLLVGASLASGCINQDVELYEVRVRGSVSAPSITDPRGTVYLEYHHQQTAGRGALTYPLGLIDRGVAKGPGLPAELDQTLLYPTQVGQGLVIYGWLDLDGDGILCAPGQTKEPAGLTVASGFPAHELTISLPLSQPCLGPERLYP